MNNRIEAEFEMLHFLTNLPNKNANKAIVAAKELN